MTLSVPSFLGAATSLLIPPPEDAAVTVAQLVPPLDVVEELEEQPAAAKATAAAPRRVKRYGDLTGNCLLLFGYPTFERAADAKRPPRSSAQEVSGPPRERHPTKDLKRLVLPV